VYNKSDLNLEDRHSCLSRETGSAGQTRLSVLRISALTGGGIDQLVDCIRDRELAGGEVLELDIPHEDSAVLARLHGLAEVYDERSSDRATRVTAWLPQSAVHYFEKFLAPSLPKRAKVSRG